LAVVGGGIVGLAHAWAAARRGWRVDLFERNPRAQGASIRNFGMIWPIGQPHGLFYRTALRSRRLWLTIARESGIWLRPCGSLHVAYRDDEYAVLEEFAQLAPPRGIECQLLGPKDVAPRSQAIHADSVRGGLWSPTEACLDPRETISQLPRWLRDQHNVELHYNAPVASISRCELTTADGKKRSFDKVIVAAGADFRALFPEIYAHAGFQLCKLQMLRTVPQPGGWTLGPMLAGGLTLRHYAAFGMCKSLATLKQRIAVETPELDQYGIHVMAAQNGRGEVILGDSHEYGDDATPFDKACIDELMLRELRRLMTLPTWSIQERWHGVYAKAPNVVQFLAEPETGVHIVIASGGAGMTMSFGLADEQWTSWHGHADDFPASDADPAMSGVVANAPCVRGSANE
jgi:FAD dependent oxidoreductase TIGR03364